MLQITKASAVVPINLYLSGTFLHGGQFEWNPTSPIPFPELVSFSDFEIDPVRSDASTRRPKRTGGISSLPLTFSFSLMLQQTRRRNRRRWGWEIKRVAETVWKIEVWGFLLVGWGRKGLLWGRTEKFAIGVLSFGEKTDGWSGFSLYFFFSGKRTKERRGMKLRPWLGVGRKLAWPRKSTDCEAHMYLETIGIGVPRSLMGDPFFS